MNPVIRGLTDLALVGYLWAAVLALIALRRPGGDPVPARLSAWLAWGVHTLALVLTVVVLGRTPVRGLHEALSALVWAVIAWHLWMERRFRVRALGAFVLPVAALLGLLAASMPGSLAFRPSPGERWLWGHALLLLFGFGAFALNFAGGLMYLLQERQLKSRRPGPVSSRLPSLELLDRLSFQALVIGFPFLTVGLLLGALAVEGSQEGFWRLAPTQGLSLLTWAIYAATLYARLVGGWRGRRAAYFAIAGFVAVVVTLSVSLVLPSRHIRL